MKKSEDDGDDLDERECGKGWWLSLMEVLRLGE
jgi:hypothetical protein